MERMEMAKEAVVHGITQSLLGSIWNKSQLFVPYSLTICL